MLRLHLCLLLRHLWIICRGSADSGEVEEGGKRGGKEKKKRREGDRGGRKGKREGEAEEVCLSAK